MNATNAIFILLFLMAVFFGCHFFIYFSIVKFWFIKSSKIKIWLAVILFLLAVSFIGASVLAHSYDNTWTRFFYFSSGLWVGIGWNLVLFFWLAWFVVGALYVLGFEFEEFEYAYMTIFAIVLALGLSIYGIWNAYHPRIKNVTVHIENLPDIWKGKKAIQLSDVHLGLVLREGFLENVVQKVNLEKPDIVFVTGDLFDGMDGVPDNLIQPLSNIKAVGGTYFVTGNHETYLGVDRVGEALGKVSVKVLNDEMVWVFGMQVVGVGYPERGQSRNMENVIQNISGFEKNNPSIFLYHNPAQASEIKANGASLQLAGHTHAGQLFPLNLIARGIYGKYASGLVEDDDFSIYTSVGVGTWGPLMRTSAVPEITVINFK